MESLGFGLGFSAFIYFIIIPLLHFLVLIGVAVLVLQVITCLFNCGRK